MKNSVMAASVPDGIQKEDLKNTSLGHYQHVNLLRSSSLLIVTYTFCFILCSHSDFLHRNLVPPLALLPPTFPHIMLVYLLNANLPFHCRVSHSRLHNSPTGC